MKQNAFTSFPKSVMAAGLERSDPRIKHAVLYQLSYAMIVPRAALPASFTGDPLHG